MDNGSIVTIALQLRGRHSELSLLYYEDSPSMDGNGRPSSKTQITKRIVLQPDTQIWVEGTTKSNGLILVDPDHKLFTNQICLVPARVSNVVSGKPFQVLFSNFGSKPVGLFLLRSIAKATVHAENLVESHITHRKMVRCIPKETPNGKIRKHHIYPKNIDAINKHLANQREIHMATDEKPTTAEDIKIYVPRDKEDAVLNMLWNHGKIWSGQISEIKATKLKTNLKLDANPFKYPQYQAIPKTRALDLK